MYTDEIYEMALEMLEPILEVNYIKQVSALSSKHGKMAFDCIEDARKYRRQGDKVKAKRKYQQALNYYSKLLAETERISDDSKIEQGISLGVSAIKNPYMTAAKKAVDTVQHKDSSAETRESTATMVKAAMKIIEKEMETL